MSALIWSKFTIPLGMFLKLAIAKSKMSMMGGPLSFFANEMFSVHPSDSAWLQFRVLTIFCGAIAFGVFPARLGREFGGPMSYLLLPVGVPAIPSRAVDVAGVDDDDDDVIGVVSSSVCIAVDCCCR